MDQDQITDIYESLKNQKITFFLMIPMNELARCIRAGLLYITNVATDHYDSLVGFRYCTEEIVLAIELAIQAYYLRVNKATFVENFYVFKRSTFHFKNISFKAKNGELKSKQVLINSKFTKLHMLVSLFFETVLPYIKSKLK